MWLGYAVQLLTKALKACMQNCGQGRISIAWQPCTPYKNGIMTFGIFGSRKSALHVQDGAMAQKALGNNIVVAKYFPYITHANRSTLQPMVLNSQVYTLE